MSYQFKAPQMKSAAVELNNCIKFSKKAIIKKIIDSHPCLSPFKKKSDLKISNRKSPGGVLIRPRIFVLNITSNHSKQKTTAWFSLLLLKKIRVHNFCVFFSCILSLWLPSSDGHIINLLFFFLLQL